MAKNLITVHTNSGETKLIDTIISLKKGIWYWKYILLSTKINKERLLEALPIFEFKKLSEERDVEESFPPFQITDNELVRVASEMLKQMRGIQEHNPNTGNAIDDCMISLDAYIRESHKRLQETVTAIIQSIRLPDLTKSINRLNDQNVKLFSDINHMLRDITPIFQGIASSMNEITSTIKASFNNVYETMRDLNISELLSQAEQKCLEALEHFVQQGWFIFLDFKTLDLLDFFYIETKTGEIVLETKQLLLYYTPELLERKINQWEIYLENRYPIVKEAALAHLSGNYYVSVPLFTIHSEGIIRESFPKKWMKQSTIRESMEKAIQQRVSNEELMSIVQIYLQKEIFRSIGEDVETFSRNQVVHGVDLKYATMEHSLRAFLFFDTLVRCIYETNLFNTSEPLAK
ncbi:hypothetical protein [Bacillus thuringiensis]|uniref:hypothetical protein n=1 Tax=Bacillus thuringiensis TaxID=1428 RepID=UPI002AB4C6B2|nr:hypothetical protein [Bacillus thuringiensis]MDY8164015.1 hypothetical protein [Bacillus thuringiensis]